MTSVRASSTISGSTESQATSRSSAATPSTATISQPTTSRPTRRTGMAVNVPRLRQRHAVENWTTIPAVESLDVLVSRLPEGAVTTEPQTLRERAIDSWALALLRQVRGDDLPLPAAVVFPASTQDVATVLAWASETKTAVIPRGAGSGVV